MSTGLRDWVELDSVGAFYPFQGLEWLLVLAAVIFWIWWHIRCIRDEDKEMTEAAEHYRRHGVENFMTPDGKPRRTDLEE